MARVPCTLRAPAPPAPDTAGRPEGSARREADRERSLRLLQAIDEAGADNAGMAGVWPEFGRIALHSVAGLPGRENPPPGHGYPLLCGAPWGGVGDVEVREPVHGAVRGCGGAGPGMRTGPARRARVGPVACNIRAATRCCCVPVCEVILGRGDRAVPWSS